MSTTGKLIENKAELEIDYHGEGREQSKWLLMGTGFHHGVMKMF